MHGVLNWWSHLSGSSRLCACNEKKKKKEKEKEKMKSRLQLQPGPSGEINFDYSYRRASAGELISHYIAVGAFSGIRNVILFAAMVQPRFSDSRAFHRLRFPGVEPQSKNVAIEEPTLPLPRPEGPEPMHSYDFLSPPSTKVVNH